MSREKGIRDIANWLRSPARLAAVGGALGAVAAGVWLARRQSDPLRKIPGLPLRGERAVQPVPRDEAGFVHLGWYAENIQDGQDNRFAYLETPVRSAKEQRSRAGGGDVVVEYTSKTGEAFLEVASGRELDELDTASDGPQIGVFVALTGDRSARARLALRDDEQGTTEPLLTRFRGFAMTEQGDSIEGLMPGVPVLRIEQLGPETGNPA